MNEEELTPYPPPYQIYEVEPDGLMIYIAETYSRASTRRMRDYFKEQLKDSQNQIEVWDGNIRVHDDWLDDDKESEYQGEA